MRFSRATLKFYTAKLELPSQSQKIKFQNERKKKQQFEIIHAKALIPFQGI